MSDAGTTTSDPVAVIEKKRRRVWPWIVLGIFVLMFAGCAALVVAADNAVDELNREQAAHAITQEQFDAVQLGTTRTDVETQLGKPPEDAQEFLSKGVDFEVRSSCIYYNRVGQTFGSAFQFCFTDDVLRSKNSY